MQQPRTGLTATTLEELVTHQKDNEFHLPGIATPLHAVTLLLRKYQGPFDGFPSLDPSYVCFLAEDEHLSQYKTLVVVRRPLDYPAEACDVSELHTFRHKRHFLDCSTSTNNTVFRVRAFVQSRGHQQNEWLKDLVEQAPGLSELVQHISVVLKVERSSWLWMLDSERDVGNYKQAYQQLIALRLRRVSSDQKPSSSSATPSMSFDNMAMTFATSVPVQLKEEGKQERKDPFAKPERYDKMNQEQKVLAAFSSLQQGGVECSFTIDEVCEFLTNNWKDPKFSPQVVEACVVQLAGRGDLFNMGSMDDEDESQTRYQNPRP